MTGVIDALKRLERAGSDDSRATQRLVEAAGTLGRHIAAGLPPEVGTGEFDETLPRGYVAGSSYRVPASPARELLTWDHEADRWQAVQHNRQTALEFARDIADGWLDELAAWLEARAAAAGESAATLDAARQ